MNRTNIEWTDYSWNPITGCTKGCPYCYAEKMANRLRGRAGYPENNPFTPTYHPNRLFEPLRLSNPSMIFTCSMGEFFDPLVPDDWRESVYGIMTKTPWHVYQILTKQRINEPIGHVHFPTNAWIGISIDGTSDYWLPNLKSLVKSSAEKKFVSFEPIIGDILPDSLEGIDWVIIGAQTGPGSIAPNPHVVRELVSQLIHQQIPMFIKPNIRKYFQSETDDWWITMEQFPFESSKDKKRKVTHV
jgi:protein gp37